MAHTIVGIGEFIWDIFPEGKEPGGAVANVIQHAHTMGERSILVSRVGNDPLGREFFSLWKERGLDASFITVDGSRPTGTVIITRHANGDASYKPIPNIASDHIPFTKELTDLAHTADAVCFGSFGQWEDPSRHTIQGFIKATRLECIKLYDINIRPSRSSPDIMLESLRLATVLKLNDDELAFLSNVLKVNGTPTTQLQTIMKKFDLDLIALTRGTKGAILTSKNGEWDDHPGIPVTVVDTVGAGDAFTAALIVGLVRKLPLHIINALANRVGSYICTQVGATPLLPPGILSMMN